MTEIDGVDAELLKALRVIRGDDGKKNDAGAAANSLLSKAIVSAIESQGTASSTQNAELLTAIKEQNMLLDNLTELLRKKASEKPKTTVVVVNKEPAQSVASTVAAEKVTEETAEIIDEPDVAAALAAADAADKTEQAKTTKAAYVAPVKKPKAEPVKPRVITGPWAFVESDVASKRRNRIEKSSGSFRYLPKDTKKEDIPKEAFAPLSNDDILKKEDALFGKTTEDASVLAGDAFGRYWDRMRNRVDQYGKLKAPKWSTLDKKTSIRAYLPKLAIGGETQIKLKSGIYYLTIKYENNYAAKEDDSKEIEAALIVGEIAFDCRGYVLAPGADWSKLFGGQKQLEPPLAAGRGGKLKWYSSKVSEPWKNGDTLKFKIDTHTNTLGYTIQGADEQEVRTGWMFKNVLAFTNNRTYSEYMQVMAYCGGSSSNGLTMNAKFDSVKLTLVETRRTQSVLNLDTPGIEDLEETVAEAMAADDAVAEAEADDAAAEAEADEEKKE